MTGRVVPVALGPMLMRVWCRKTSPDLRTMCGPTWAGAAAAKLRLPTPIAKRTAITNRLETCSQTCTQGAARQRRFVLLLLFKQLLLLFFFFG